jgi:hypothetical protein
MKTSCPASPPRLPWLPPTAREKLKVVLFVAASKDSESLWKTHENQRPARHECTSAVRPALGDE